MPRGIYPRSDQCKHCAMKKECDNYLPDDIACMNYRPKLYNDED